MSAFTLRNAAAFYVETMYEQGDDKAWFRLQGKGFAKVMERVVAQQKADGITCGEMYFGCNGDSVERRWARAYYWIQEGEPMDSEASKQLQAIIAEMDASPLPSSSGISHEVS